jgi:hypothetical protein
MGGHAHADDSGRSKRCPFQHHPLTREQVNQCEVTRGW